MTGGLLIRIEPRVWTVEVDGSEIPCSLSPKLFRVKTEEKNPVAVGDHVTVRIESGRGVIEKVGPRKNRLARPSPSSPRVVQVTAVNLDRLVVVSATQNPPVRPGLIDRFLVAAEYQGMDALIVVNKCDEGQVDEIRSALSVYHSMGYPLLFTSALTGEGVKELGEALASGTSLFVGHSGVGKSSLMNCVDPRLDLATQSVAQHGRGRHTTTSVSLWRLPSGGHLVDSPGIRGFGLTDIPLAELGLLMPDLRSHASHCRYPDCTHDHEPNCAVKQAAAAGEVEELRYDSYLRMLKSLKGEGDDEDFSAL